MAEWYASGRIVDLILALMALEGLFLMAYRRWRGRGVPPGDLWLNLLSGGCMLLALRGALVGAWWGWIALGLTASLATHLVYLRYRWQR